MHLLAATPGTLGDGTEAVDLGQTPGDIVFLTAADTEIAGMAVAYEAMHEMRRASQSDFPSLRVANLLQLGHNMSVDLYVETVVREAKLVVVRLLGGTGYWAYGVERLVEVARRDGVPVAFLPGDDQPDADLAQATSLDPEAAHRLWQYLVHGGPENMRGFLAYAASLVGAPADWSEPMPLLRAAPYWPGEDRPSLSDIRRHWEAQGDADAPVVAITFYRALVQSGNLAPIDALIAALTDEGLNPLPVFVQSLKEQVSADTVSALLAEAPPAAILNATGFAVASPGGGPADTPFDSADCPVLQVVLAGTTEEIWRDGSAGMAPRDIAMNVALPEVDGRVLTRAIAFKGEARFDEAVQASIVTHQPVPDRVAFVAKLAAAWAGLRQVPAAERRVALILANYPNRDGRLANGVGLDTPAGTANVIAALTEAGYDTGSAPDCAPTDGAALMDLLRSGPTNAADVSERTGGERLALDVYRAAFDRLPETVKTALIGRWGDPEDDPFFVASESGDVAGGAFVLPCHRFGNITVGIQPARGYNIDPVATYHNPDLVPPHGYLAFYIWLREVAGIHAVVHMGKHGNLEWLPGKALALSADCWPEVALGPVPHLYPFIVNDPGEGTQAKRRAAAVIVDHLTPPLTRAESYGPLAELERLVDEYYQAAGVDPRRIAVLRHDILDLTQRIGLDRDLGIAPDDDEGDALAKLDNHLCELKEMQIRDGLHIFGDSPDGDLLNDLLVALVRIPRGDGTGSNASLIRALATDLGLADFDPLDCEMAAAWTGPKPETLLRVNEETWRSNGDTVERLEGLAADLVAGRQACNVDWTATCDVLSEIDDRLRPAVTASGAAETEGVLTGLSGHFVAPGPSGAPTRGRPEVLPTGRNFFSVDSRAVPTPAAWQLGWKSATLLIDRYRQDHGDWPRRMALSAWGTANMRTGGDDIAQALALMGARPTWDDVSGRVTGFEVMPLSVLDRPRVDVTCRVSGFFRDAFPTQIDLIDSAARVVAALDEPDEMNPLAAHVRADAAALVSEGAAAEDASRRAGHRVFGSKPGAYGAGLQALIDENGWDSAADLARAYVAWGGYAYGNGTQGAAEHALFRTRLGKTQAVVHNQDNREHDLLDSDDYYQFEGGMAAAVELESGARPPVYHNDHSRPETPKIRSLEEEIARVVRARVVNPKWIAGVMRHGYKGAFEMAATVDYMFAFAATTGAVKDHHFDLVFDAYLANDEVRGFMEDANPDALKEMADRLREAERRGMWHPRSNTAHRLLAELSA